MQDREDWIYVLLRQSHIEPRRLKIPGDRHRIVIWRGKPCLLLFFFQFPFLSLLVRRRWWNFQRVSWVRTMMLRGDVLGNLTWNICTGDLTTMCLCHVEPAWVKKHETWTSSIRILSRLPISLGTVLFMRSPFICWIWYHLPSWQPRTQSSLKLPPPLPMCYAVVRRATTSQAQRKFMACDGRSWRWGSTPAWRPGVHYYWNGHANIAPSLHRSIAPTLRHSLVAHWIPTPPTKPYHVPRCSSPCVPGTW